MVNLPTSILESLRPSSALPPRSGDAFGGAPLALGRFRETLLVGGGLLLVFLIGLLDYATGPWLSWSILYLLPVAACAWWGGSAHGILVALSGALAGDVIDSIENPLVPDGA